MEYTIPQVQRLDVTHAEQVVSMLCDAFDDYPVMRFILVNRDNSYPTRLRSIIHMFVMARYYRNEPVLGILNMNVPFYERRGYKIMGHTRVAPALETWAFFRPDRQRKI
jgi:hypothetical protein